MEILGPTDFSNMDRVDTSRFDGGLSPNTSTDPAQQLHQVSHPGGGVVFGRFNEPIKLKFPKTLLIPSIILSFLDPSQ